MKHVALLRGINVGGRNPVRMTALRSTFEALGFSDVATYITSGNVVFEPGPEPKPILTERIERALATTFDVELKIVLVSAAELATAIAEAPPGFGSEANRYRYDVLFVKPPLTPAGVLPDVETTPQVDEVHAGSHVVYFRRVSAEASRSRLAKIMGKPVYQSITIRNWRTTTQLLTMAER